MFPRDQPVIVPLAEAIAAIDLQHTTAEMQPDEKVGPGIGLAIHVDCELSPDPAFLRNRLSQEAVAVQDVLAELIAPIADQSHIGVRNISGREAEDKALRCDG